MLKKLAVELNARDVLLAGGIAFLFLIVILPFGTLGVDVHHDGIMLKPAADVAAGAVLFRDTFSQYGPASTLFHAALMRLFGSELRILRFATIGSYCCAMFFVCLFWRSLLPRTLVVIAAFWVCCLAYFFRPGTVVHPWSSSLAVCVQAVSLWLLALGGRSGLVARRRFAFLLAGAAVSLVFWFRQPVGAALAVSGALVPFVAWHSHRRQSGEHLTAVGLVLRNQFLWSYIIGGVSVAALFLVWMVFSGSLGDWYVQNVVWPRRFAAGFLSFEHLRRCFLASGTQLCLPTCFVGLLCLSIEQRVHLSQFQRRLILVFSSALWYVALWFRPDAFTVDSLSKWIPLGCGLLLVVTWWRQDFRRLSLTDLALVVAALSSWAQYYPVACIRHKFWGVFPIVGVFFYLLHLNVRAGSLQKAAVLLLLVSSVAIQRFDEGRRHLSMGAPARTVDGPLFGMRPYRGLGRQNQPTAYREALEEDCTAFEAMREFAGRDGTSSQVILYGDDAMWALITSNLENAGAFYVTWNGLESVGALADRSQVLKEENPWVVVQEDAAGKDAMVGIKKEGYVEVMRVRAFGLDVVLLKK